MFVAELLKTLELGPHKVRSHKSWSGKECPRLILPHWSAFLMNVKNEMTYDVELCKAVDKLIRAGVQMNAPAWNDMNKMNLTYAATLIERIGALFGAKCYHDTIDVLVEKKVITDRDLWDKKSYKAEYIRVLLIRVANAI